MLLLQLFCVTPILIPECLPCSKSQENKSSRVSKSSANSSVPTQSSSVPANNTDDDFDDFDPRGTSTSSSKYSEV